ncbi:zinc knuckle, partial [Cooperia oncophora]
MRVERRRMTLENARSHVHQGRGDRFEGGSRRKMSWEPPKKEQNHRRDDNNKVSVNREEVSAQDKGDQSQQTRGVRCYNCKGKGHIAKDCKKRRELGSRATNVVSEEANGDSKPRSEISIVPLRVLQRIEREGHRLREHPVDKDKSIFDASGNRMKFVKVVEVPLQEGNNREITLQMHVCPQNGTMLVLGTNALKALNYVLIQHSDDYPRQEKDAKEATIGAPYEDENTNKAVVGRRAYVAPGEFKWVTLKGKAHAGEHMLHSCCEWILSGLCSIDEDGVTEVPVWNATSEALVLKVNQEVGTWEPSGAEYAKVAAREANDMLVVGKPALQTEERWRILNTYLRDNREKGLADEPDLWRLGR